MGGVQYIWRIQWHMRTTFIFGSGGVQVVLGRRPIGLFRAIKVSSALLALLLFGLFKGLEGLLKLPTPIGSCRFSLVCVL